MYLKRIIKRDYEKWYDDPYIYQKNDKDVYKSITYGKFIEDSLGIANYLINKGYKNKNIIIISENSIKLMEVDLAVTFYVGISAVVSREWKLKDLIGGIKELNADLVIYSSKYTELIDSLKEKVKINTICMDKLEKKFSKEMLDWKIKNYNTTAKIVFSSGTTGKSKAVKLSLKNIFAGYKSLQRRCHLTHKDSAYLFLPLNHTYAAVYNFMYSLVGGFTLYLASSTQNIGKELLETNPTVFCAVPLVYNNLLAAYKDNVGMAFGKNIKHLFCGGAPISKETRQFYKDKGLNLMQAYALSETASSLTIAYPYSDDLESVGTIFEDLDVKIYEPDKDGVGEIIVKGDCVFLGYTDDTLTRRVFDEEGYFHTGDLGYIKDRKIFLQGRKKKMLLTSNGENVMADAIEDNIKKDKIVVDIYVNKDVELDSVIEEYNSSVPKYERVESYNVYKDSLDTRLKQ